MTKGNETAEPRFPSKLVSMTTLAGFVAFFLLGYLFELHEFLTTRELAGLYGSGLRQSLSGWFSIHFGLLGWFALVGVPGALVGAALGIIIGGFKARRAV